MKFSKESIAVLKNFATINSNLLLKEGNKISTINAQKNVMATATLPDSIPLDFGIYDLNEFLGVLSLFEDPTIEITDKLAKISQGASAIKFYSADPSVLTIPTKEIKFPGADVEFTLTATQIATIMKTASVIRGVDLSVVGADGKLSVVVGDLKNPTSNNFVIGLGDSDRDFTANIKIDNLKLMGGLDYAVKISAKKISQFSSVDGKISVFIALESSSSF